MGTLIEHDNKSVNCIKLIKGGFYLASGGHDRFINIYKVIYQYDSLLKKSLFEKLELEKRLQEEGFVYSINNSSIDSSIIFSSSSDCSVKVWNILSGKMEK